MYKRIQSQRVDFDNGSQQIKKYDPNNDHPYKELDITKGPNGEISAAQVQLEQNIIAAGGSVGQIFGSALGRAMAPNDPFKQIVAGTVAGLIGQKLLQTFTASLTLDASRFVAGNFGSVTGLDIAHAGIGAISSFLTAELGHELKLTGLAGNVFNAGAGGVTASVLIQVVDKMGLEQLSFSAAIGAIKWGTAATQAGYNISSAAGTFLANAFVPAQSHEGAVGGQLFGAVGSALGLSAVLNATITGFMGFLIPGLGSLFGTIVGTMLGDAIAGDPVYPMAYHDVRVLGSDTHFTNRLVGTDNHGNAAVSEEMGDQVVAIANSYLDAVHGAGIAYSGKVMTGYNAGAAPYQYITGWFPNGTEIAPHFANATDAIQEGVRELLRSTEAIGGNLLMKRAHQAFISGSHPVPDEIAPDFTDLIKLSGDLSVAQDYQNYLNNREAINALIAANPNTAFAAGWIATFARVNDLKLNEIAPSDFLGGLVGYLDSVANAGLASAAANASVKRGDNGSVVVEVKVANGAEVPGALSVFADHVKITSDAGGQTVQFTVDSGLAARAYNALGAGAQGGDGFNDLWFGRDEVENRFIGTGGDDILVGGAMNDGISGGAGWDFIDGGYGNDYLYGQEGGDILRGGRGTDFLFGGIGNDTYAFSRGDGVDTVLDQYKHMELVSTGGVGAPGSGGGEPQEVHDDAGSDTLAFGPGIAVSDIAMSFTNDGLVVVVKDPAHPGVTFWQIADRITVLNGADPKDAIEKLVFADGTTLDIGASLGSYLVPFGATLSRSSVAENSAIGTVVGTVTASDLNAAAVLTYSLIGDVTGGRFTIDASSGVIRVAGALNYEGTNAWPLTVRVTDQNGHSYETPFVINVTNVNEAPTAVTLAGGSVPENSPGGTIVGTASASDPDAGTVFRYSLLDDAGGRFYISPTSGVIVNVSSQTINYEGTPAWPIVVRAADQYGQATVSSFVINVTDVNEAPTGITLSATSVPENSLVGTHVATAHGIDPDAGTVFSYSLTNDVTGGRFAINASSGDITVTGPLNYEGTNAWPIVVRVADQHGASYASSFTIAVTDVPERMHAVVTDFNGDGKSDILWTRDNGTVAVWDSGQIANAHWIADPGVVPGSWHIKGDGDFDFNGHDDILWQNDNTAVSVWDNGQLAGAHIIASAGVVPASMHIAGVGDFDGNHRDDVLWRDDNGAVWIWDDGQIANAHIVAGAGVVPAGWHIDGIGDFDGNLKDDILWHHDDGRVSMWDDGKIAGAHLIVDPGVVANSWKVAGTGDFDGNGRLDILWRNDNGAVSIWDNGQIGGAHIVAGAGSIPAGWHIEGVGDFDGNGRDDVLWRNDNSTVSVWDNGTLAGAHWIADPGQVASSWHIV